MSRFIDERLGHINEYVPGEQPQDNKYIKLNTNESPYEPPQNVVDAVNAQQVKDLRLYSDPVSRLDVEILQEKVLAPLLKITSPRTDKRIEFVGGIRGLTELVRKVDEGCAAAFAMYPTTMEDLMAIADAGRIMPPKSTWFEPKLRSGLFIHELDSRGTDL